MSDFYGALQVPAPMPVDCPDVVASGDPFLDTLVSFLMAAINADLQSLWEAVHPAAISPHNEALPISFTFTHDPDEASFIENQLPALYAWRADEPRHVDWTQEWTKAVSNVSILWIPPLAQDEHRRIRQPFRNAFAKSLHRNLYRGRNPAWVVDGDTEAKAAEYGSLFITQAQVSQYFLRGVQGHTLSVGGANAVIADPYECILATLEVHEVLTSSLDDFEELADVRGSVSVGTDVNGLNALTVASYRFEPGLLSMSPTSGAVTGGTAVTIKGTQFYVDTDGISPTLATDDGTALLDVTVVDEGTITATMPAHATGLVDLVLTTPAGTTATLASAFTYA